MNQQTAYWLPVALSRELKHKPIERYFNNVPVVLFRDAQKQAAILENRCPHRHAPLSLGQVKQGEIECPYHGWRFNSKGQCTSVPGLDDFHVSRKCIVPTYQTMEYMGMIWICASHWKQEPSLVAVDSYSQHDVFAMSDTVHCTIAQAAENFLDACHTHFIHAGWLRNDEHRQVVEARVEKIPFGVQACYKNESKQAGWVSKLFERDRGQSWGRFILPGVAQIEYHSSTGLSLLISAWFTPKCDGQLYVHAQIVTPRGWLPAWVKRVILKRIFYVILKQDKDILHAVTHNQLKFRQNPAECLSTPLDLLAPYIQQLLAGEEIDGSLPRLETMRI